MAGKALETQARAAEGLVDATGEAIRSAVAGTGSPMRSLPDGMQRAPALALSAMSDVNRVLMEGAQEMAREWAELVQSGYRRGSERMSQAMSTGSPADLAMLQPTLAREAWESWIAATTKMTDVSLRVADRTARAWTGAAAKAAPGMQSPRSAG
jgi:hypothetical protein